MAQACSGRNRSRVIPDFRSFRAIAAAAGLVGMTLLAGGCQRDVEKADANVEQKIAAADLALAYHPGKAEEAIKQANQAITAAQTAVNESGASDIAKANAQSELAMAESNLASIMMGQLESERAELASTLARVDALSSQISVTGHDIAAAQKFQPVVAEQTVTDEIAKVQGGADKSVWMPHATAPIPSLSAVADKISSLNNDIDKLQEQRKQLSDEQADAARKADDLTTQADKAHGKAAVDLYTQAADARKTASDKKAQVDLIDGQLQPLQQQLTRAQNEQTDLNAAVAAMKKTNSDLADGWDKVKAQIDSETARVKDLVDGSGGARPAGQSADTVNALSTQWADQTKKLDSLRAATAGQLNKAATALEAAVRLNESIQSTYRAQKTSMPDAVQANAKTGAWTTMIDLLNPGRLYLRAADVQQSLADLYQGGAQDAADESKTADRLQKALAMAQVTASDALSGFDFAKQQKDNANLAEKAYKSAEANLTNATVTGGTDLTRSDAEAAKAAQVIELYSHGQFDLAQGDEKDADDLISQAKSKLGAIQQSNGQLPAMIPLALLPEQTAPSPGPASAPSTQPAGG